ncbi:MAG: hypothetical protein P8Y27_13405 [Chromatiaceae bacterium]
MSTETNKGETGLPPATGYDPSLPAEEQYAHWILHLEQKREAAVKGVTAMLWEDLSRRASRPEVTTEALCRSIRAHLTPVFLDELLPECASWTGHEATPCLIDDIAGLDAALQRMPAAFAVPASDPAATVPSVDPFRWLLLCLVGGFAGIMVIGTGDSIGANLGGVLGAAGAVAVVAYLSRSRAVRARLAPHSGVNVGGKAPALELRKKGLLASIAKWPLRKAADVGIDLAARLVGLLFTPEAERQGLPRTEIAPAVEREFDALATLAFLMCVVQQPRELAGVHEDAGLHVAENSVQRALTVLIRYLDKDPDDLETIRDMALELQQRLQDAGYAWQVIADGEPFREELLQAFRPFGLIEAGQPVQTLEPAVSRNGVVILPGTIARLRG